MRKGGREGLMLLGRAQKRPPPKIFFREIFIL